MRILLADVERGQQELCRILTEHALFRASSVTQAQSMLAQNRFDALITSVQFDESRMYELLRFVRSHKDLARLPFIVLQWHFLSLKGTTIMCVRESLRLLGATTFVDLATCEGRADIAEIIRREIETIIATGPRDNGSHFFHQHDVSA